MVVVGAAGAAGGSVAAGAAAQIVVPAQAVQEIVAAVADQGFVAQPAHCAQIGRALQLDALNAVLLERNVAQYRFDARTDRPMAQLSNSQVQALRLLAEGKTNQQIAEIRQRSLAATESLVSRTLTAIGIDPTADHNSRVVAATHFITRIGTPPAGQP